ncbi:hypothetical protein ACHAQH_004246 [Verticillium albo-atrum]
MAGYGFTPSGGAIFGIVVGVIVALIITCIVGWHIRQRNHRLREAKEANRVNDVELAVRSFNSRREARGNPVRPMPTPALPRSVQPAVLSDGRHRTFLCSPTAQESSQRIGGYGNFAQEQPHDENALGRQNTHYPGYYREHQYAGSSRQLREERHEHRGERQNSRVETRRQSLDRQHQQRDGQRRDGQQQQNAEPLRRPRDAQHQQPNNISSSEPQQTTEEQEAIRAEWSAYYMQRQSEMMGRTQRHEADARGQAGEQLPAERREHQRQRHDKHEQVNVQQQPVQRDRREGRLADLVRYDPPTVELTPRAGDAENEGRKTRRGVRRTDRQ